jgi:hypothetical protein
MVALFRQLSAEDEQAFRQWARDNYKPFEEIDGIWHPVVQDECVKINQRTGYSPAALFPPGP